MQMNCYNLLHTFNLQLKKTLKYEIVFVTDAVIRRPLPPSIS